MNELISLSATQMRQGLIDGKFSSVELVSAHLSRIESTNEQFNSFITIARESALTQAAQSDKTLSVQKDKSPLLTGIPVAIKDMLVTKGLETTCASKILKGHVPPYDGTAVARLRKAGAVVIGKTNLDEFAMGASNENSAFGPVRNPWDITCVPGGSSGGSAVAVCLGQAPLALGTDTGGSIRQPAGLTGIVGLRPTYGRVSRYGAVAFASSLDQIGPFARTVPDIAMILQFISGFDEHDSTSMDVDVPDYLKAVNETAGKNLSGVRIGVPKEYFIEGIESDVERTVRDNLKLLADLGAEIVEVSLPHTRHALAVYYIINPAEASSNLARYDGVRYGYRAPDPESLLDMYERTRQDGFGKEVKRRILIGTFVLSAGYYDAYYLRAQQVRTLIINDFKAAFANKCDVIAAPVSPTTAFKLGEKISSPLAMYLADIFTVPVNLAGLPGLTVPAGLDAKGLPIGLQFIGPPFSEATLLSVGHRFGQARKFDVQKMTTAYSS